MNTYFTFLMAYFKPQYKHKLDLNKEGFSISKLQLDKLDIIGIYRSQEGNVADTISHFESLIVEGTATVEI